jgi:hypothetical protein
VTLRLTLTFVRFIATVLTGVLLPVSAGAGELFRYRLQTEGGRHFEYVFEASAQPSRRSITRQDAIRIATDWMTTFHHLQLGSIQSAEFKKR